MIGELILHLGDFRTGSTAIQSWLRDQGLAQGIYYPPGFNHAPLAHSLPHPDARAHHFGVMADHMAASDAPFAVISAEHFEFSDPADLAEALAAHMPRQTVRMRLISYVRPHPQSYLARFAESAKIGSFEGDLDGYLDWPQTVKRMTYAPRFERWKRVFGEAFHVRLYDRSHFVGGDVLRDFASFVTGTDPGPQTLEANPSPGLESLAYARAFHRAIGALPDEAASARWTLGRHLGRQMTALNLSQTPLQLHKTLAERLVEQFQDDAAATDAAYFDNSPLSKALAAAPAQALEAPQSLAPEDHLNPQAIEAVTLWGNMMRHALVAPGGSEIVNRLYHE
ncbi:hypothetical protein [Flavimaricola marinus]|uniref:Sulfotransferase family protein n=1 Tax=Flavimaricola marinus TaxID=1819565 RepID=A0A238LHY7_9RHOB|nr:hypothetical protein [Flavimaricola marinus]SMY09238.1 hypothetical protein LOM8899_03403 [Flavimaricola marinus]